MSNETTPPALETPPSWFPLPRFTPTPEIRLHAAELRLALLEKEAAQSDCKRTPRGYLKKGEEVPYQEAQQACDIVFRKHAPIVRESMSDENEAYIRQATRAVFGEFIGHANRFAEAISAWPTETAWTNEAEPQVLIKSSLGNQYKFRFSIDAALITRVEIFGDERFSIVTISHDRWNRESKTQIGSVHLSRGEPQFFIEFAWLIDITARLCQDVAEHNDKYGTDNWQSFSIYTTKAEKEAYGIVWDDCKIPDPIEKEDEETETPTA